MPRDEVEVIDRRYRLGALLGRGGAADVYVADDLRLERQVAIKRYRAVRHGIGLRRFMAEAELLAKLSHPALLTVFDVSYDGERPFLVLEYVPAGTLRDRLDTGGALWPDRVASLGAELADVLAYVHDHGIVHRDIKPSNVLFNTDGDCYLADFGIARALGAAHLTATNEFIGTAAYLAPEQVLDRDTGSEADVYALGLMLLECLSGEPEYSGTDVEMAIARLSRPPRIPGIWGSGWRAVLTAMTAADPAQRPSAKECATMLRAVEAGDTKVLPAGLRPRRASRVLTGIAGLAVLTATAFTFNTSSSTTTGRPVSDPAQVVHQTPAAVTPANVAPPNTAQADIVPTSPHADAVRDGPPGKPGKEKGGPGEGGPGKGGPSAGGPGAGKPGKG